MQSGMYIDKLALNHDLLKKQASSLYLLAAGNTILPAGRILDCDPLVKCDYSLFEVIGLLGFDTKYHKFVLFKIKNASERSCHDGAELSQRGHEVVQLVARGLTNAQIAKALFISKNTVKVHLRHIFEKIEVQRRTEAAMYAAKQGWLTPV